MGFWDNIHEVLNQFLVESQKEQIEEIRDEELMAKGEKSGLPYYRRASLVDPELVSSTRGGIGSGGYGVYKHKHSYISNQTLKEMSLRDSIIASIVQTRINQIADFSKPQPNKYETGFKFSPIDTNLIIKPGSPEEKEIKFANEFIINTGLTSDRKDSERMNFNTFLQMIVRDRLTFAYITVEKIPTLGGGLHHFLPAPAETMFFANPEVSKDLYEDLVTASSNKSKKELEEEEQADFIRKIIAGDAVYVQMINNQVKRVFDRNTMIFKIGNPQNFIDNNGYPISELEMATNMVTIHLQAENYNKLFFTSGFAARGLLHIRGEIAPSQLQAFRAEWRAQIAGSGNSWRTPVMAGAEDVQFIPLAPSNRDMEYISLQDHIIRTLCSLFQISPIEIGFDYLTKGTGQKSLSESNNEWKVKESKSRGLKPVLTWIEDLINNDILPEVEFINPETKEKVTIGKKYKFAFVGLNAESKEEELNRQGQEVSIHSSINEIRNELEKDPIYGGNIPLNPAFINVIGRYLKVGEVREHFLKEKDASKNEEYDYIPDASYFQNIQIRMAVQQPNVPVGPDGQPIPPEEGGQEVPQSAEGEQGAVEAIVAEYLNRHPDALQKSIDNVLMKSQNPKEITTRYDKMREHYLESFDTIQREMIKEILDVVKEDTDLKEKKPDDESEKDK